MPDRNGKLSNEERRKVADFINSKATAAGDACLVCGEPDTRIGDVLLGVPQIGDEIPTGEMVQPVISVTCHNCGFIRYFHAERFGLVPRTIPEED